MVAAFPDVEIGSYPEFGPLEFKTKLTIDGDDAETVLAAVVAFEAALPAGSIVRVERP